MKNIIITNITRMTAMIMIMGLFMIPSGFAHADSWDWDYSGDWGSSWSDDTTSGDWGSSWSSDTTSGDWGSSWSDTSGDWGSSWSTDTTSGDWGSSWSDDTTSGDWGSSWSDTSGDWGSSWSTDTTSGDWGSSWSSDTTSGDWGSSWSDTTDYSYVSTYEYEEYEEVAYETGGGYTYYPPTYTYNPPVYTTPVTPVTHNPVCSLSVSDNDIEKGDAVTLRWDNTYANRMYINDSYGNRITTNTASAGSYQVSPTRDTTYTMYVQGTNGASTNCSKTVSVDADTPTTHNPVCSLSVSDSDIKKGDTVTLRWDNTRASRMHIDDSRGNRITSDTSSSGSIRISPTRTTTYTMTVRGSDGGTDTCAKTVTVDTDTVVNGDAPVCRLRVSDTVVRRGMSVLLTWDNSSNSREMYIKDSNGTRIVDSTNDSGRYTVVPSRDTTYTMRVSNSHGSDTCSVSVDVQETVVTGGGSVTIDRVPLAQVPYTGFDAGPYLTTLFYLLLGAWAVAIAYYVMRRKYGVVTSVAATPVVAQVIAPRPVAASVATAPVAGFPMNLPTDAGFAEMFGTATPVAAVAQATDETGFSIAQHAATSHVFITDEVMTMIAQAAQTPFAQKAYFDAMVAKARGKYPTEHGWLTIDSTRAAELQ